MVVPRVGDRHSHIPERAEAVAVDVEVEADT